MKNQSTNWVFLRGLSREAAHWAEFPRLFEEKFPGAKAMAIDLPGNGEFHAQNTPTSLIGIVEHVRETWSKRNPTPGSPVHLFGMSLGAMVSLQWMQRYPGEIASSVLINTSLRGFSPFYERMSPSAYGLLLRVFIESDTRSREELILRLTSQKKDWDENELRQRVKIQEKHPVSKWNAIRQIGAALSTVDSNQRPPQPVLILNSLGDLLVHPKCSQAIAKAWSAPIERHAWAGHDLVLDDPQWTLESLAKWYGYLTNQNSIDE